MKHIEHFFHKGIDYTVGDLITAFETGKIDVLAHQANCFSTMGAGIAGQISRRLPKAYAVDVADTRLPKERLGGFTVWEKSYTQSVYNLYGQFNPGRNTDLRYLRTAIRRMRIDLITSNMEDSVIGFPLIGCGIGGADWRDVSDAIKFELDGFLKYEVYVFEESDIDMVLKS